MDNYQGISGGLFLITEWIMKFALVNLYWLLFNLPIGIGLLLVQFITPAEGLIYFIIALVIMLPVLLFPATTAMFGVVRDYIMQDAVPKNIFKLFLSYYQENYKRSIAGGILLTALWGIWAADVYYLFEINAFFFYVMLAMGIVLYVFTINFFSVNVHLYLPLWASLKNTMLITLSSPVLFLTIALSSGFILYISIEVVRFIVPFFTFSLIVFFSFSAFYRYYLRVRDNSNRD